MGAAQTPMAQMNIRLSAETKAQGDAVLAQHQLTPTAAVRSLWWYLAQHQALPGFLQEARHAAARSDVPKASLAEEDTKGQEAEGGAGMALRLATQAGFDLQPLQSLSYGELRDLAFDEYLIEREQNV